MLSRNLSRRFSTRGAQGILGGIRSLLATPKRLWGLSKEPSAGEGSGIDNTTFESFDEEAEEWQALIFGTSYSLQTAQMFEQLAQGNFGTVDNPHVIFTSDAPFRYVGCTGLPNSDDYEGHEFVLFMLREGPLQRCPICGQVFKLVRLRKEYSSEMDYYTNGLLAPEFQEFGKDDHFAQMSVWRMMPDQFETASYTRDSHSGYTLMNPDDHDRVLVDPAFRMQKLVETHHKYDVFIKSLDAVNKSSVEFSDPFLGKATIQKDVYDTLIDTEIAMRRLDRAFKKARKFHARQFIDQENHERREKRMLENATIRGEDNYTVYFGGMSEIEARYNDYFQTDGEGEDTESFHELVDEEVVRSFPDFRTEHYNFIENSIEGAPIQDATSFVQRLIFRFKNRRCVDSVSDYERRQARMVSRQIERATSDEFVATEKKVANAIINGDAQAKTAAESEYLKLIYNDSLAQYADYFETEGEENIKYLREAASDNISDLLAAYRDYSKLGNETRGQYSIAKRQWNQSLGFTANLLEDFKDYNAFVLPKLEELSNITQANMITAKNTKYRLEDVSGQTKLEDDSLNRPNLE